MQGFDALGKKINQIESYIDEWIKKIGANYGEFAILYTLAKDGQSTQKCVADEWCMPKQSVFNVAKDLRAKNLISLLRGERDKREQIMSLTPAGERLAQEFLRVSAEADKAVFGRFGAKNSKLLFGLLDEFSRICADELKSVSKIEN